MYYTNVAKYLIDQIMIKQISSLGRILPVLGQCRVIMASSHAQGLREQI